MNVNFMHAKDESGVACHSYRHCPEGSPRQRRRRRRHTCD